MPRQRQQVESIDDVRRVAAEVEAGSLHPFAAAKLITESLIETPYGMQPKFLLFPTAVHSAGRDPDTPMTLFNRKGEFQKPQLLLHSDRGGVRLLVRAMSDPRTGSWPVSDPNIPAQRMKVGGAGVTNANYRQLDTGTGGWYYGATGYPDLRWHRIIRDYATANPYAKIGMTDIGLNDGSYQPMPDAVEGPGHYFSEQGQSTIATYSVLGLTMLALPHTHLLDAAHS